MKHERSRRELFVRFASIGVVGFLVDAAVVAALVRGFGVGAYQARPFSYLFAVTTTWWLNRQFTFASRNPKVREYLTFIVTNAFGAGINLLAYAALIAWRGSGGWNPIIGVAVGSVAGLFSNFFLSSKVVFRRRESRLV